MNVTSLLTIGQIGISLCLIGLILLQQRGGGLTPVFGGSSEGAYHTRRGAEKIIFWATVVMTVLFLSIAFLRFIF